MRSSSRFPPLSLGSAAHAPLVRQANTTLTLPVELPVPTGFVTQNVLGTLTFANPIDVTSRPGVTNRLFVLERGAGIQIVNLEALVRQGEEEAGEDRVGIPAGWQPVEKRLRGGVTRAILPAGQRRGQDCPHYAMRRSRFSTGCWRAA